MDGPLPAIARDSVRTQGPCSARSAWKFRVSPEDGGRLEVEWEVDSHVAGQRWNMAIKRAGVLLKSGRRTTDACGDAELRVVVSNAAGTDGLPREGGEPGHRRDLQGHDLLLTDEDRRTGGLRARASISDPHRR